MGQLVIKALTGPVEGKAFLLKDGLRIGRSQGNIILLDPMVSDLHAEIRIYSNGKIMIFDQNSKNKIIINNRRLIKSVLEKGTKFKIGKTEFELAFVKTSEEILAEFISKNSKEIYNNPLALKPFVKSILLVFAVGLQKGQGYRLFYGPRFCGSASVDIPILEQEAPKRAFALIPDRMETLFVTKYPDVVKFNGMNIKKIKIKSGDRIIVGKTHLKLTLF